MNTPIEALEDRIAPAGIVLVAYDAATTTLTLTSEADNAVFDPVNVSVFQTGKNSYRVETGAATHLDAAGNPTFVDVIGKVTSLHLVGADGDDAYNVTNFTGLTDFSFAGGKGNDALTSENLVVKKNATVDVGDGGGMVTFNGKTTIGGNLVANFGANGGQFDFAGTAAIVKGATTVTGGAGSDFFIVGGDTATFGKGIKFTGAGGGDNLTIGVALTATIGKAASGNAIDFDGGDGDDVFQLSGNTVSAKGNVVFTGGNNMDSAAFPATTVKVDGETKFGGLESFELFSTASNFKKTVTIGLGDGGTLVNVTASSVTLGKDLTITGGNGDDVVTIRTNNLSIGGAASFDGQAGDDGFGILSHSLSIKGAMTVKGGTGADSASITADGTIKGDVSIDLDVSVDAGSQDIVLRGYSGLIGALKLGGKLDAKALTTDSMPNVNHFDDTLTLTNVIVAKAVTATFSADANGTATTVKIDNLFTKDALTIDTGAGNDDIEIERGNFQGRSVIGKLVDIKLGDGTDTLNIGKDNAAGSNDFVVFGNDLKADGGAGTDTRNDFATKNVFQTGFPTPAGIVNFEAVV